MEIEVKQPEGFYLKAYVSDITDDGLDVVYERNWRKPERVKFEQCRAVLTDGGINKQNFKAGDIVDAFVRIDKMDKEEMHGWNKMKIRDIKNDFAVVDSAEGSLSISDIVPVSQCRHPALASQISSAHVKSCTIPLGDDHLFEYFAKDGETYKVLQESVPAICIKLDETNKELVIKAFSAATIKKVEILKEAFLSNSRQKMLILQRQEENKKMLSLHEPQHEAVFCMEFDVSTAYMGLAIGSQGANISNARKLEGVQEVVLDESKREDGYCKFKIYAQNAEAAQQARNMLEFLQKQKFVPQSKVGQVIGKQGKTIQDIVDKSGVVRVQIGDENPEQGMVPLTFTGTCEAISNAELMVDFHLKHITAMDEIRAEDEEIKRKLYLSRNSPFQHYNNSSNNGQQYNSSYRQQNSNNQRTQNGGGDGRGGRGQYQPQQDGQVRGDGYRGRPNGGRGGGGRFNQQDGGRVAGRGGGRFYGGGGQRGGYGGPPRGGPGRPRYGAGGGGGGPGPKQQRDQREEQQERVQSPNTQQGSEDERDENGSSSYNGTTSIHTEQQSSPTTSNKPSQQQNAHKQGQATGGFGGGSTRAGGGNRNQQQRNVLQRNRRSQADEE